MCLHTIKNGCVERKIAQEDIPCVKILNEIDGALYSPFKAMLYVLGKKYEATIGSRVHYTL